MIYIINKKQTLTDQQRIDDLNQKFSILFFEFKENGISSWLFYILYIVRRFIIVICLNFVEDYILQLLFTLAISLVVIFKKILFYILISRCYKSQLHYVYHIINDSLVCAVYLIVLVSFDDTQAKKSLKYTNLCINLITASWAINILLSLLITFLKIYDKIKSCIAKRVKVTQATKITEVKTVNDKKI